MLGLSLTGSAFAQPEVKPNSLEAMGCMKLKECTDDVIAITSIDQIKEYYRETYNQSWQPTKEDETEIIALINRLNEVGVEVYLAHDQYFMPNNRGLYYTDVNRLFLNEWFLMDPRALLSVLRHEGWHAAQDCMAGTINNSFIAVIYDDMLIPQKYKVLADLRYGMLQPRAIPWEQEAIWAGNKYGMTADALNACGSGVMWEEYKPTPLTEKWLVKNGYIKD